MSSTALISCRMKIDLYLLNCYPLNPSILQTMPFVNSTCLKISRIIFWFTTIFDEKMKVTFLPRKLLCLFFCLFVFLFFSWLLLIYMFLHDEQLILWFKFSSFSFGAEHSQSAKPFFSSEQDMLHSAITESIRMNSHRESYCTNAISLQVINSIYPSFNMIHICFWSSSH